MSSTMQFEQITGPRRLIVLRGRAMPYRPISFARNMRVVKTWMPANPKAIHQVIGATFDPTNVNGIWKDKFLGDSDSSVDLINFPQLSLAASGVAGVASSSTFNGTKSFAGVQRGRLARVIVDAFELMLAEGQDIRWQWEHYVRFGKISRFVYQPGVPVGGVSDIAWELELDWSGDIEAPVLVVRETVNLLSIAAGLSKFLQALAAVLAALAKIAAFAAAFVNAVLGPLIAITGLITTLIAALRSVVSIVNLPGDFAKTVAGLLQSIRLAARGLANQIDGIRSAAGEASRIGACDAVQIAALVQQLLRRRLVELAGYAAEQQRMLDLFEGSEIIATIFADAATSLRDVSARFYGSPDNWIRLSTFNAFYSSVVKPGTLIRVPRLS